MNGQASRALEFNEILPWPDPSGSGMNATLLSMRAFMPFTTLYNHFFLAWSIITVTSITSPATKLDSSFELRLTIAQP